MNSLRVRYKTALRNKLGRSGVINKFEEFKNEVFSMFKGAKFSDFNDKAKDLTERLKAEVDESKYNESLLVVDRYNKSIEDGVIKIGTVLDEVENAKETIRKIEKTVEKYFKIWQEFCAKILKEKIREMLLEKVEDKSFKVVDIVGVAKKFNKVLTLGIPRQKICNKDFPSAPFSVKDLAVLLIDAVKDCGSWEQIYYKRYVEKKEGYLKSDIEKLINKSSLSSDELKSLGRFESAVKMAINHQIQERRIGLFKLISNKKLLKKIQDKIDKNLDTFICCAKSHATEEFGVNAKYYKLIDKMEESVFRRKMKIRNSVKRKKIKKVIEFKEKTVFTYALF